MAQASHHLLDPLQVEKTAGHVRVGIGWLDRTLIGLQDRDFGLFPVTGSFGLRGFGPHLDSAAVDRHHGHLGAGTLRVSDAILGHEGKLLMRLDRRVPLIDPLAADRLDQPLDRLGLDVEVRQRGQVARRLQIRRTVDAGMDDLLLDARAEATVVKAQSLILREKKPADIGGSWRHVVSRRRPPAWW